MSHTHLVVVLSAGENCKNIRLQFCRYQKVIEACALQSDIDSLPAGDATEIGEKVGQRISTVGLCFIMFQS